MSVKRRIERQSCTNKIRYENMQAAIIAMRVLDINKGYRGKPYECQFCGHFHVGGPSKERKKALKMQKRT